MIPEQLNIVSMLANLDMGLTSEIVTSLEATSTINTPINLSSELGLLLDTESILSFEDVPS